MAHASAPADDCPGRRIGRLHAVGARARDGASRGIARAYFAQELRTLGAMSVPERWALALFGLAMFIAFTRQLYATLLPGLTPTLAFLTVAIVSFAIRYKGVALLEWDNAEKHMVWGLIYFFARIWRSDRC